MQRITGLVFLIVAVVLAAPVQTAADMREQTSLTATLDRLNKQGSHCGDQLNVHGVRAVSGAACKAFTAGFHSVWRDRAALDRDVAEYVTRLERSGSSCDTGCLAAVQRVDELKTLVNYYLDYIDFLLELEN